MNSKEERVELFNWCLSKIFDLNLNIPDYQRIYCWYEKNVIQLLEDLLLIEADKEYRLGTLIFQKKKNEDNPENPFYDIIDGQQRLVTLSLILLELGNNSSPLLSKSFYSEEAAEYIAYNKYLIKNYLDKFRTKFKLNIILKQLTFNVLVLNDESLDLAYTFFSNENSRGCPLSDFDLLKAHHLRYIQINEQAQHLSTVWDKMLLDEQEVPEKSEKSYERALGLYIFRLRKWINYDEWDETEKYKIKNEYEAARINDEIPPFGEQFQYKEPIQGGSHFFAYVNRFRERFLTFRVIPQYTLLHTKMTGETHHWFRDVIESLVFAYYLKFGTDYISEATALIIQIISQARYENYRIYKETIFKTAKESKIALILDRSTSPTFFIAALNDVTRLLPIKTDFKGIRLRYSNIVEQIMTELQKTYLLKDFEV